MPFNSKIDLTQPPLSSAEVMALLGYRSSAGFYEALRREGIPHIKISARRYVFPIVPLVEWMKQRENAGCR